MHRERHREIIVHPLVLRVKIATKRKRKIQTIYMYVCMYDRCESIILLERVPAFFFTTMHIFCVCILYTDHENSIEKHPLYSKCQFERVLTWLSTILHPARVFLSIRYEVERAR